MGVFKATWIGAVFSLSIATQSLGQEVIGSEIYLSDFKSAPYGTYILQQVRRTHIVPLVIFTLSKAGIKGYTAHKRAMLAWNGKLSGLVEMMAGTFGLQLKGPNNQTSTLTVVTKRGTAEKTLSVPRQPDGARLEGLEINLKTQQANPLYNKSHPNIPGVP